MRAGFVVPPLVAAALACAHAYPVVITSNGQWATLQEFGSTRKACGVQAGINGGTFLLSGATDRPGVLRLSLSKSTWHIPNVAVPILLSFPDGEALSLNGSGQGSLIRADIPASLVKPLMHHFTADDSATMTLPQGHEAPWRLDLHGTTPAVLAMGPCIDAAQIFLPPPFRPPNAPATVEASQAPMGNQLGPEEQTLKALAEAGVSSICGTKGNFYCSQAKEDQIACLRYSSDVTVILSDKQVGMPPQMTLKIMIDGGTPTSTDALSKLVDMVYSAETTETTQSLYSRANRACLQDAGILE